MELRIETNARNTTQATAWAGQDHIATFWRERKTCRAKIMQSLPPLSTSPELRLMASWCIATADALDAWGGQ